MNIEEIKSLAISFRDALDEAYKYGAFGQEYPFCRFPSGCCDDVCNLFGELLFERNIDVHEVRGTYYYDDWESKYSHVWLQLQDGTVIDLTGDQYKDDPIMLNYNEPCYVGRPNQLHHLFYENELVVQPYYGIKSLGEGSHDRLWKLYHIVMSFFE